MNTGCGTVLVVDDESSIRRVLRATLTSLGFVTVEAGRGEEAMSLLPTAQFHAVLLDINMPGMGGIDAGADDYITKPFQLRELTARLRAAIRRAQTLDNAKDEPIHIGDIDLDPVRRRVYKQGRAVHLTPKEFEMLHYLMAHAGQPIPHTRLLNSVWGPEYGNELEYLRTFMRQLRKKLEDDPAQPKYLLTDAHVGYRFHEQT